jgi:hypothetical protein
VNEQHDHGVLERGTDPRAVPAKGYEAPALTIRGSVADLTGATHAGAITDKSFPSGTPLQNLTFS